MALIVVLAFFAFAVIIVLNAAAKVVPQQEAWVVERLGRYEKTLTAGLHLLMPFVESVRYRHPLKEQIITVDEQDCITKDNVLIKVDAVLYFQIIDPVKASYGIADAELGIVQLSQTTVRSEIGKIDLDRTFEERPNINAQIVGEIDKASIAWGVKVLRYEIKNIKPPVDIREAMERQKRAEREKRAVILESEGRRDALINNAEGKKQEEIKSSEAEKQRQINEAEGRAAAIRSVASATAEGIRDVAKAITESGGSEAVQLRVAEQYIQEFGKLAKESNTIVLPASVSDVASMIATAMGAMKLGQANNSAPVTNSIPLNQQHR
jgi:regulator of protease activity HflC (stomatin/prohibitin superfamily)